MKQYQLTPYQQKKCREFFAYQKVNDFIYASTLKSKIAVDIKIAYKMLEELKNQGYLVNIYEVYCFDCDMRKKIIDSLVSFDDNWTCDCCEKPLSVLENTIVLYKVVAL